MAFEQFRCRNSIKFGKFLAEFVGQGSTIEL